MALARRTDPKLPVATDGRERAGILRNAQTGVECANALGRIDEIAQGVVDLGEHQPYARQVEIVTQAIEHHFQKLAEVRGAHERQLDILESL